MGDGIDGGRIGGISGSDINSLEESAVVISTVMAFSTLHMMFSRDITAALKSRSALSRMRNRLVDSCSMESTEICCG